MYNNIFDEYAYTDTNWKDKLTSYNGQTITYDAIGNPLSYRGMTMSWQGRQLTQSVKSGQTIKYTYDADGLRASKTVGGTKQTFQYLGGKLMYENRGDGKEFYYSYDGFGNLACIRYYLNGVAEDNLYVVCNSRGDVEALYGGSGTLVARYIYDAWGNTISVQNANGNAITSSTHIANLNRIRYRGYYWDAETNLYYLQSRYYDPVTCRFVNADSLLDSANGYNVFSYCGNNPIQSEDKSGEFGTFAVTVGIMAIGGLIGAGVSAISSAITQKVFTGSVNLKSVAVAAVSGFVSGAIAASPLGLCGQIISGGAIGCLSYVVDSHVNNQKISVGGVVVSAVAGAISGRIGGKGANNNRVLTNTLDSAKKSIEREFRRNNQVYAQKVIAKTVSSATNTFSVSAWCSSARFAAGCGVSNVVANLFS